LDTSVVGISDEAWWTEFAQSLVVLDHTGSVAWAHCALTWVLALVLDGGGGVTASGADTDRLVVQHLALLPGATSVIVVAGVLALPVVTGLV
jgi:hypothetical protein